MVKMDSNTIQKAKQLFIRLVGCLLILGVSSFLSGNAHAALPNTIDADPYGSTINDNNALVFDATSTYKATYTYSINQAVTATRVTGDTSLAGLVGSEYTRLYVADYSKIKTTDWIKVTYQDCGSYQPTYGDPFYRIDAVITYTNMNPYKPSSAGSTNNYFEFLIGDYIQRGYRFKFVSHANVTYEFYYRDGPNAGQKVSFDNDNGFLAFASLNNDGNGVGVGQYEFVIPRSFTASSRAYVINSPSTSNYSNIKKLQPSPLLVEDAYVGASNDFVDNINDITFHRNTVSVSLHSNSNTFTVGNRYYTGHTFWMGNFSISMFRGNPGPPSKDVLDTSGTSIDGEDVLREQTLYYEIKQRTAIMGTNLLTPWSSFSISDSLPTGVTYVSSSLEREESDGTRSAISTSNAGTFTYNSATREVKFVANSTFLTTTNKYDGQYYVLKIRVKVDDNVPVKTIIANTGSTSIEGLVQETNEVTNQIPYGNLELTKITEDGLRLENVEFSIKDKNGTEQLTAANNKTDTNGKIEIQELHPGTYTITEVSVPWGYQLDTTPKTLVVKKESETTISKIEIVNYYTRFKLHLRQAVVGADNELVVPSTAYFSLDNVDSTGTSAYLYNVIASSSDKHSAPITQSLFTTRVMRLDAHLGYTLMDVAHIVPEYYEYLGYTVSKTGTSLNSDHVFTSSGYVASTYPSLDYSNTLEYWVTVYIQPKYGQDDVGDPEDSPRPYSWDRVTNDFGTIKLE